MSVGKTGGRCGPRGWAGRSGKALVTSESPQSRGTGSTLGCVGAEEGLGQATHHLHSLPQLGPGSPPGVWVCSTDMLLSVPPNPGEPAKAGDLLPCRSQRGAVPVPAHPFWAWPTALFRREALEWRHQACPLCPPGLR